jgi:hypothetical protein
VFLKTKIFKDLLVNSVVRLGDQVQICHDRLHLRTQNCEAGVEVVDDAAERHEVARVGRRVAVVVGAAVVVVENSAALKVDHFVPTDLRVFDVRTGQVRHAAAPAQNGSNYFVLFGGSAASPGCRCRGLISCLNIASPAGIFVPKLGRDFVTEKREECFSFRFKLNFHLPEHFGGQKQQKNGIFFSRKK